jgi:hypothetical protein
MKSVSADWVSIAHVQGRVTLNSLQSHLYGPISLPPEKSISQREMQASGLLNESAAADWLGQRVPTLRAWRSEGKGPTYAKVGRAVFYEACDLKAWIARQKVYPEVGNTESDKEQKRALALPDSIPGKGVSKKHRLGGYRTQRQRREDDRGGGPQAVEERRLS